MDSNVEKTSILEGVLQNLFECMNDKDEIVRNSVEASLTKIVEKRTDESLNIISEYRTKHPKLSEQINGTLLRVIENVTTSDAEIIQDETIDKIITLAVNELTKSNEHSPAIQKPALEILVGLGRNDCDKVMQKLISRTPDGTVPHFMIMHCMGTLAVANVAGVIPFIKPVLSTILPNLGSIKQDHVKQAHAFAIGRFSEALIENKSVNEESDLNPFEDEKNCATEISVAYDYLLNQWLYSREPKVCVDILQALSSMYPLLPVDKIQDQSTKLISSLLGLYRRSIDRNAVTQFLASAIKTNLGVDKEILDPIADLLVTSLFDLVCVSPDYEKPQTVKGHYEVLRCYHILASVYAAKILEMLLLQLRNNNERERIKALLVLTHLTNASRDFIENRLHALKDVLKQMIVTEKAIKMKMTLLKMIVALAQKGLINESEFIWFIVRYSCKNAKNNTEHGSSDEHNDFARACQNSLFMLSSTVGTVDLLLKRELLCYFIQLDYTDICSTIAKCLSTLFAKDTNIELDAEQVDGSDDENDTKNPKTVLPSAESIFTRCLALMGNFRESQRITNVLSFLRVYSEAVNPELKPVWDVKVPELNICNGRWNLFLEHFGGFLAQTIETVQSTDAHFAERLVNKMSDQLSLYPIQNPACEFVIPNLSVERGMLLKTIGIALCYVKENQTIEAKIDLIINAAKEEKLEKHAPNSDYEHKLVDASKALGFISKAHLQIVLRRLTSLASMGNRKTASGFFGALNFIKDSSKESENYKVFLLVFEAYGHIIECASPSESLKDIDDTMINFLIKQLFESKDQTMKKVILNTFLSICNQFIKATDLGYQLKSRNDILRQILDIKVDAPFDNLPIFPTILKLATTLIRIDGDDSVDVNTFLEISCRNFFTCAQNLKNKFDSPEDDYRNSFLAQYLNQSLPELNSLVKVVIENDPSPACLDDVVSILEHWMKDKNSEVRICAGHVMNSSLEVYIKSMKIGCEAPSKFNQTGQMLGRTVPRCIDSNATVRQTSVDILQKILEISHIYETLTIADSSSDFIKDLQKVREDIVTDDAKEIYQIAGEIARIIATRISSFQYLQFCKTLLYCLKDPEQSSAIGASVVLKFFIQEKGAELFHAIPELVKESLYAIKHCEIVRAKSGILKALVALTKHHPKLVCSEMLAQPLPFEENVVEYWQTICIDLELSGIILENFLSILSTSCLYEPNKDDKDDLPKIATTQPFAIFCAMKDMFPSKDMKSELKKKFPELFTVLLTSLATYTNLAPPILPATIAGTVKGNSPKGKSKFGYVPNKDAARMVPCQIVIDAFQAFLSNLEMEQFATVLSVCPHLSSSGDMGNFIALLTPIAVALVNQFTISSSAVKQVVTCLTKYVASPYEGQRVAAVGLYSQLIPLKPIGEICSVIMLHLSAALSDPSPIVRGLAIRGLAFVGNLTAHDVEKYSEMAISALLKGIDDFNSDCLINIPLESKRGLSLILRTLPGDRVESFHISLAIRIRPFFENSSIEIREAAILLFGDLCESKMETITDGSVTPNCSGEALKEQLFANLISLLLHLSENEQQIVRACKVTLRKVCALVNAPKVNEMAQKHLLDHGQLNYDIFIVDFIKIIGSELKDQVQDLIESAIPFLKSYWTEIRGNAAIIIGILHNYSQVHNQHGEAVGHKLAILLRDDHPSVKHKAATALGYFFGDI